MKKAIYEFLAILALGVLVVFLSSCIGGAGSGGITKEQFISEEVKFSSMASIPLVHGLEVGSYNLEIQNGSNQGYFLKNFRIINPISGKQDSELGQVDASSCSKILAKASCNITIKPLLSKSASFILEADMLGEDEKLKTIRQIVRVSDKLTSNEGIMLKNDVSEIASINGGYSLVIPILLTQSFDSISVDNGSLVCHDGYTKNSSCSYILSGTVNHDTLLTIKITGYRQNHAVSINSFSTNVTKKGAANLLLSQPDDIIYTRETPLSNRTILTVFNNGNYTASNIGVTTTGSISVTKDNTTTCGTLLAPHTACNISVETESQVNGSDLIAITYLPSNVEEFEKTVVANVLRIVFLDSPFLSINRLDGSLTDASKGETKNINLMIKNDGGKKLTNLMFNLSAASMTSNTLGFNAVNNNGCGLNGSQSLSGGESCVLVVSYSVRDIDGISNDESGIVRLGLVGEFIESDGTSTSYAIESSYLYSTNLLVVAEFLGGSQTVNHVGSSGDLGVPSPTNLPRARRGAATAIDKDGNLWMFGGGNSSTGATHPNNLFSDLWKYDVKNKTWIWMNGSQAVNQSAVYGTRGVQHPNNRPGSRNYSLGGFDKNGDLWIFGGYVMNGVQQALLNDLWKYDVSTNQWTWMKGSSATNSVGNYGRILVANDNNEPPSRIGAKNWIDESGNFWIFGGERFDTSGGNMFVLSDLWKYDVSTNQWTWMKGVNSYNSWGSYGSRGVPHPNNQPPGLSYVSTFSDNNGNLWMFGGTFAAHSSYGLSDDLWKYDVKSNLWTWISGRAIVNGIGTYGDKGNFNRSNVPGGRSELCGWADKFGNVWIFGGFGSAKSTAQGHLNASGNII